MMTKYIVRIRLVGDSTEPGITEEADSPREAARQRIERLVTEPTYEQGTVIVTPINARERAALYIYDWTRETKIIKEVSFT